jgi:hypothetical protein
MSRWAGSSVVPCLIWFHRGPGVRVGRERWGGCHGRAGGSDVRDASAPLPTRRRANAGVPGRARPAQRLHHQRAGTRQPSVATQGDAGTAGRCAGTRAAGARRAGGCGQCRWTRTGGPDACPQRGPVDRPRAGAGLAGAAPGRRRIARAAGGWRARHRQIAPARGGAHGRRLVGGPCWQAAASGAVDTSRMLPCWAPCSTMSFSDRRGICEQSWPDVPGWCACYPN